MNKGHVWQAICSGCDHGGDCCWQEARPEHIPGDCFWCLKPGADAVWEHTYMTGAGLGRVSGFSTSESDFTPHWNTGFGKPVHSLKEMKALQAQHGATDMVVKGDAAERLVPRDIGTRLKHTRAIREALDSGKPYDAGHGVKIEFVKNEFTEIE